MMRGSSKIEVLHPVHGSRVLHLSKSALKFDSGAGHPTIVERAAHIPDSIGCAGNFQSCHFYAINKSQNLNSNLGLAD
jgi:hypothetical protein